MISKFTNNGFLYFRCDITYVKVLRNQSILLGRLSQHDFFICNQENVPRNGVRGRHRLELWVVRFGCISCSSRSMERQASWAKYAFQVSCSYISVLSSQFCNVLMLVIGISFSQRLQWQRIASRGQTRIIHLKRGDGVITPSSSPNRAKPRLKPQQGRCVVSKQILRSHQLSARVGEMTARGMWGGGVCVGLVDGFYQRHVKARDKLFLRGPRTSRTKSTQSQTCRYPIGINNQIEPPDLELLGVRL